MELLPLEIIRQIYQSLDIKTQFKLKGVCKDWKDIYKSVLLQEYIIKLYNYQLYMKQLQNSLCIIESMLGRHIGALMWSKGRTLIITSKSKILFWENEIKKLNKDNTSILKYSSFYKYNKDLILKWDSIIFDDCQKLNNDSTKTFTNIKYLRCDHVLFLSNIHIYNINVNTLFNLKTWITQSNQPGLNIFRLKRKNTLWDLPSLEIIDIGITLNFKDKVEYNSLINIIKNKDFTKAKKFCSRRKSSVVKSLLDDTTLIYKKNMIGNYTNFNKLILIEPPWDEKLHRLIYQKGQKRECYIYRLYIKDTFEEILISKDKNWKIKLVEHINEKRYFN